MKLSDKSIFHVHSYRCGHAEQIPDEAYITKAIELGADSIWFTDHAPFEGDLFRGRMPYASLEEYLSTLYALQKKYEGIIPVHIGMEIEYLPSYDKRGYYKALKNDQRLECLILGQHMAEDPQNEGHYNFEWDKQTLIRQECVVLGDATVQGIQSGYFDAVAHPDRIFKRRKKWTHEMNAISERIIEEAHKASIPLEVNMHAMACRGHYWKEFWAMTDPKDEIVIGLDAHSIDELERRFARQERWLRTQKI